MLWKQCEQIVGLQKCKLEIAFINVTHQEEPRYDTSTLRDKELSQSTSEPVFINQTLF